MSIEERLRERRLAQKLTLGQVAVYEAISAQYLSELERSKKQPHAWELLVALSRRYGCSTDYLLGFTDDPTSRPQQTGNPELWTLWQQTQRLSPNGREKLTVLIRQLMEAEIEERRRLAENLTAGTLWREIEKALSPVQAEQVLDLLLQIVEESEA